MGHACAINVRVLTVSASWNPGSLTSGIVSGLNT
jgi:hypothetical protein